MVYHLTTFWGRPPNKVVPPVYQSFFKSQDAFHSHDQISRKANHLDWIQGILLHSKWVKVSRHQGALLSSAHCNTSHPMDHSQDTQCESILVVYQMQSFYWG